MTLDDLQRQWQAQSAPLQDLVQINPRRLSRALDAARTSLFWSKAGDVLEAVLAGLCLLATGTFLHDHFTQIRFLVPAAALHLWFIAVLAVAVARLARKSRITPDAPVLVVQRQIEAVQAFSLRALRLLFVSGVIVWGAPFCIVAAQAWFGWDLYAWPGGQALLELLAATAVLALLTLAVCAFLAPRLPGMPRLARFTRDLAGYNLKIAQARLAQLTDLAEPAQDKE